MKSLTFCYITARKEPHLQWFIDSLVNQMKPGDPIEVIVVDFYGRKDQIYADWIKVVEPKPSVWYGPHRLTKQHWWGVASFRNTGLCLAKSEWFAVADDRSILGSHYLEAVREAMENNYAVAGAYEKVHDLVVENGLAMSCVEPTDPNGRPTGKDPRRRGSTIPRRISGNQFLGCTSALPLEWALNVNGWDCTCDSLGLEDCLFGAMLENNGYPLIYDERMLLLEDRTPGKCDIELVRTDKGKSPNDRSHMLLHKLQRKLRATHPEDLRETRAAIALGQPWPVPTSPTKDYYDGQPLSEMYVH